MAQVVTTAFTKVIKDKLYANAEFVRTAFSHDAFVNDKTVEIPLSGTLPDVVEDRSSYPIAVTERTDSKQSYNLIEFSLGAIRLPEKDVKELSYDKAASIVSQHMKKLSNSMGLRALYNWAQSSPSVETTGTAVANIAPPSGTGNRQPLELVDIANAASVLDGQDVSPDKRYLIVPYNVYWNFVTNNKAQLLNLDYNKGMTNGDIANGVVAKVYGFNIIVRSYTAVYNGSDTLKAVGAAAAATDQWAIIGYQADEVCRALGSVKVYLNKDDAIYQGDLYSATVRFNAVQMRGDDTGIVTILQDT